MPISFTSNAELFAADLNQLAEELGTETSVVVKMITLKLWGELVELTPVDTGRAQASWRVRRTDPGGNAVGVKPPGKYGKPAEPDAVTSQRGFENASVL